MVSTFFIDRPIFSTVLSLLIVIAGAISLPALPIEQYPQIAPPTVQVTTAYPGASSETVMNAVTTPLEQEINGVEDMLYLESLSSDDGSMKITVTFELGTDLDLAAVRVQNRIAVAEPRLPEQVRVQGVLVEKASTSTLMYLSFFSPDGSYSDLLLSNFVTLQVKDVLARLPGVGSVGSIGAGDFAMRIWLDPDRLSARALTVVDVISALREQNVEVAAGRIGQEPSSDPSGFQLSLTTQGRLREASEFEDIVLKQEENEEVVRLSDVARVELGARSYDTFSRLNGSPSASLSIAQLPGSNALEVSTAVREALAELARDFPEGVDYEVTYDYTDFVSASIAEVVTTLLIAIALVFITVFAFLQDWRATLVPAATIPVSLIGTFAALAAFGLSINLVTLFALILAIGIVVDDAIVVVENVQRHIDEDGMAPREASVLAMEEITGAVVATTLVLLAVFVPTLFLGGISGTLYLQFGATISVATVISSVNALTLSPALCAVLLRPSREARGFGGFNRAVSSSQRGFVSTAGFLLRRPSVAITTFLALIGAGGLLLASLPTGFIPEEDQSVFFVNVQLPDGAKLARTDAVLADLEQAMMALPDVRSVVAFGGMSFVIGANQPNSGILVVVLENWDERPNDVAATIGAGSGAIFGQPDAIAFPIRPPAIQGIGQAGGFDLRVQDRTGRGIRVLETATGQLLGRANQDPGLANVFSGFRAQVPQARLEIDRERAKQMGVALSDVFETLRASLGSAYVNDFNLLGRTYQVQTQAEDAYRDELSDVPRLQVRNAEGAMVPLGSVLRIEDTVGAPVIPRYNLYPSATILGSPAPGRSSGDATARMEALGDELLPDGIGFEWSGVTYQEKRTGQQATIAFGLAILVVFLFLAAQYESWSAPAAVLLTVPIGVLGALAWLWARGLEINVYTQLGFVLLIALVAKNAILIVEFARQRRAQERNDDEEPALAAARLRFRPLLMTAASFILGTLPLVIASGAGAASRQALGTAVFGGMIVATFVGMLFVPAFDTWLAGRKHRDGGRSA